MGGDEGVMRVREEKLVEVSRGGLRVGVSVNEGESGGGGKVRVWRYADGRGEGKEDLENGEREKGMGKGKGKMRESLIDSPSSPTTTTTTSRKSTRQRSSRPSIDVPHTTSSKRRTSQAHRLDTSLSLFDSLTSSNSPEVNRRTSLTRNDLSVTMDRMALSQGSSIGGNGGGNPNLTTIHNGLLLGDTGLGLGEMDREATLFLGEEEWVEKLHLGAGQGGQREEVTSEIRFECVWEGELDGTR